MSSLLKNKYFSDSYSFLYVHLTHSDSGYKFVIVRTSQSLSVTLISVTHLTCGNLARAWIGSATLSIYVFNSYFSIFLFFFCPFLLLLTLVSQSWQTLLVDANRIRILSVISLLFFITLLLFYFIGACNFITLWNSREERSVSRILFSFFLENMCSKVVWFRKRILFLYIKIYTDMYLFIK